MNVNAGHAIELLAIKLLEGLQERFGGLRHKLALSNAENRRVHGPPLLMSPLLLWWREQEPVHPPNRAVLC
jgi:hypothetical protein